MKLSFLFLMMSLNVLAVSESEIHLVYQELNAARNYELKTFTGRRNLKIDYMKFGKELGKRGAIVMAVGRNEASLKYLEFAYDMYQKGFSPIYITSHRGQGLSERRLKDPDRGYVRHFRYYSDDLKRLTDIVISEVGNKPIYLVGHSMGGAIALEFLQRFPSIFSKAVLTAPMHKILLDSGEADTLRQTALACYLPNRPYCTSYVPDGGPAIEFPDFNLSDVTSSRVRFDFREHLYQMDKRTRIGSSTIRWVRTSILANQKMRSKQYIDKIQIPFLILQAGRELVVDNSGSDEVCKKTSLCQLEIIEGSLHNILMEKDLYRNIAMKKINSFFTLD